MITTSDLARALLAPLVFMGACSAETGERGSPERAPPPVAIAPEIAAPEFAPKSPVAPAHAPALSPTVTPAPAPAELRWIAAGGGALPELNQVSIEQDIALARRVLGEGGLVLFAGGPGSPTVQVQDEEPRGDELRAALAELFAPRGGRDAHYRDTALPVAGAATASAVLRAIEEGTRDPGPPLVLYFAGHGERGEDRSENYIGLWEQSRLRARELAEVLDRGRRPARVIATTCFSGGFAELAFRGGDPGRGAPEVERCGLFATTWDLEASGCDPNPDRRAQEGYGLHFFNALAGLGRDGEPLPRAQLDLDGDGTISPLEAHARVRIASRGIDVPTTTSERWLRQHAPTAGASAEPRLAAPEDAAVISRLAAALELTGREREAELKLAELEQAIDAAARAQERAQGLEDAAYRRAAAAILARWPVLDDPWHPDFDATLRRERERVAAHLERDPSYAEYRDARAEVDASHAAISDLRQRAALHERLARALENQVLAGRLQAQGGAAWREYRRLLACERASAPSPT